MKGCEEAGGSVLSAACLYSWENPGTMLRNSIFSLPVTDAALPAALCDENPSRVMRRETPENTVPTFGGVIP